MTSVSKTEIVRRNMAGALINKVLGLLLPFACRTVLIYYLGTLYLGLNSLFTSILQVLNLAELGFGSAIVFSMYKPMAEDDTPKVCALLNLYRVIYRIVGVVVLAAGLIFTLFLPRIIHGELPPDTNLYVLYLINLINVVLSYLLFAYKNSLLTASQRLDVSSNISTLTNLASNIARILAVAVLRSYYAYCVVIPVFTIVSNLVTNHVTNKMFPQYRCKGMVSKEEIREIAKKVTGLFLYKVCHIFRNSFDSIVLSAFLGLAILGKYNNYYYILSSIIMFTEIITGSITSSIGHNIVTSSQEKNYRDFKKIQVVFMWIVGWCTVCLFCLYQPFMRIWVGEALTFSAPVMTMFCVYFFTMQMGCICFAYRQAAGLWWQDKFRPIFESIANLILNIALVKLIGVAGVLLSTILCLIFINSVWGSRVLFKNYFTNFRQSEYLLKLVFFAAVTFIACALTGGICALLPQVAGRTLKDILWLLARAGICVVAPNGVFAAAYRLLPEYKDGVEMAKRVIKKRL